jgi:hypothetical protein
MVLRRGLQVQLLVLLGPLKLLVPQEAWDLVHQVLAGVGVLVVPAYTALQKRVARQK